MATHNEPQSYGSQGDWASGKTGQSVDKPESEPVHEVENEGGSVSPVQFADTKSADVIQHGADDVPASRVTSADTGAKRDSFFKDRDYKE
ncbi:MAG TPA: hypothetical protein VGJ81_19475 [Thermoanaerobaculia bacterium]|jgi:hypothetical protein